jgi:hypothetical protein
MLVFPAGIGGDYPAQLALSYIGGWLDRSPHLQAFYRIPGGINPHMSMDIFVPLVGQVVGVYWAGALMIALSLVLAPIGAMLLARALNRKAPSWIALFAFVPMLNANVYLGFIEFWFTCGLALVFFAGWVSMSPGWRRSLLMMAPAILLFFSHLLGFLLFGYLVALWEVGRWYTGNRGSLRAFLRQLALVDSVAFLPALLLMAIALAESKAVPRIIDFDPLSGLIGLLIAPFLIEWRVASLFVAALFYGVFYIGLRNRWLQISTEMAIVCVGLLVLVLLIPRVFLGIAILHVRFGAIFAIVLAASCALERQTVSQRSAVASVLATLLVIQFGLAAKSLRETDRQVANLRSAFSLIEPGSRLLKAWEAGQLFPLNNLFHIDAYATIDSEAYVPDLFTDTSRVAITEPMKPLHFPGAMPLDSADLASTALRDLPRDANAGNWNLAYFWGWPNNFDYLLYWRTNASALADLDCLIPVAERPEFILYRIKQSDSTRQCQ